jgi:hypothetical protein
MMRSLSRFFIVGLAVAVSGCVTSDSIDLVLADPTFEAKAPASMAQTPAFRVGDVFRFRVGEALIAEKVEKIDAEGVWWRDSIGRRWIGEEGSLIPTRAVSGTDGKPQILNVSIESKGDLFPLTVGKSAAYRSKKPNWLQGEITHNQSCGVEEFGALKVAAGTFDTYKLKCLYDGALRFNYYAPALGRVVLQTTDTVLDSVKRELIGFERGAGNPLRTAQGAEPKNAAMMAKKMPAALTTQSKGRYGIQLAAYRSPTRIKKVWTWIKRRGGPLLADFKPNIERIEKDGSPLFRLAVGDFATKNEARAHCRALKRKGIDCWPRALHGDKANGPVAAAEPATSVRVVSR